MQIKLIKPGILTTVQDLGRPEFKGNAIPLSGAMDRLSARLANKAIGNADTEATLEFTFADAAFTTITAVLISYSGEGAFLKIGNELLPANCPIYIPASTTISLTNNQAGCRTYLAIAGGWRVDEVLGSRSTYITGQFGGYKGRALLSNDMLSAQETCTSLNKKILSSLQGNAINYPSWRLSSPLYRKKKNEIRVVPGEEFGWFDGKSIVTFLQESFKVSLQSNRMGFQLDGPLLKKIRKEELLSTAVTFGTIQVTGNGSLIILMADAQTTGGYPRIAQVAMVDLPICAQLKPNDYLSFKEISRVDAESMYLEQERVLTLIDTSIRHKFSE